MKKEYTLENLSEALSEHVEELKKSDWYDHTAINLPLAIKVIVDNLIDLRKYLSLRPLSGPSSISEKNDHI